MPRIRSVHPGFFTDEAVVGCSMAARVLLIGLWTEADDGGVFSWKPITLKMRILPADTADVNALLAELEAANVIRRYEAEGANWGAIRNFMLFQRPKSPKQTHPRLDWVPDFCGESRRKFRNGHLDNDDDFGGGGETGRPEPSRFPKKEETLSPKSEKSMQMEDGLDKKDISSLRSDIADEPASRPSAKPTLPAISGLKPGKRGLEYPAEFVAVWETYPRRDEDGKRDCYQHYRALIRSGAGHDEVLSGACRWRREHMGARFPIGLRRWLRDGLYTNKPPDERDDTFGSPTGALALSRGLDERWHDDDEQQHPAYRELPH